MKGAAPHLRQEQELSSLPCDSHSFGFRALVTEAALPKSPMHTSPPLPAQETASTDPQTSRLDGIFLLRAPALRFASKSFKSLLFIHF